jgi:hypothetical protein
VTYLINPPLPRYLPPVRQQEYPCELRDLYTGPQLQGEPGGAHEQEGQQSRAQGGQGLGPRPGGGGKDARLYSTMYFLR